MASIEELFSEIEANNMTNEIYNKELEDLRIQNEILKSEKKEIFVKIIDLEFKIKKFGAKPKSHKYQEFKAIQKPQEEDNEKSMNVTIEYDIPEEYKNEENIAIDIIGNFTEWIPHAMEEDDQTPYRYKYTASLRRGYKHRYQFLVNGNEHIDENKKSSVKFDGSKTNYIMVPLIALEDQNEGKIEAFMCQDIDSPQLLDYPSFVPEEIAKRFSSESINEEDKTENTNLKEFVHSKISQCADITQKKQFLETKILESGEEKDRVIFRSQYKELDSDFCKIGLSLKKALKGRIIHTTLDGPTIFEIDEYNSSDNTIRAKRIYDQNRLLLDNSNYGSYVTFRQEDLMSHVNFLTLQQEASVRMEMHKDYHKFKIFYQVDTSMGENECLPMSVDPSFISLNDYRINFDKQQCCITSISNNNYGNVQFIENKIDPNAGFISNSVFEVWTNEVNDKVFNIIHCHINDMSDSVPIATEYIDEGESISDHMEFGTDSTGQVLRYKILIQNHKILTVLYNFGENIDEIPFNETKLSHDGSLYQLKNKEFEDQTMIVKLNKIPISMTCASDKKDLEHMNIQSVDNEPISHCKMRYFERLPGYVDLEMISADNCMSLYQGEYKFSAPACMIEKADDMQRTMILSMQQYQKEESVNGIQKYLETLEKLVEENKFAKYESLEEMKNAFQSLKTSEEKIGEILGEGNIDGEDLISKAKQVTMMSSKILRGMAAEMRMMAMRNKT
ncbi:unnamed protein product [Moneuplotes crassus]|uniref:AMP-activated protein kinase glycogen-binding domain-containing protein n=1 Tax=Euplotes crassus TaxID=5936 RepID=A0AAD1TYY9_EUPCR|nr:unnamed protein product [Moneuplotes crassus]